MSVWKQVKNNALNSNCEMELLEKALERMGVTLDKNVKTVSNAWGHSDCDAALVKDGVVTALGIKWTEEKGIELVGDPYCSGIAADGKHQSVLNQIAQYYVTEKYNEQLQNMGFCIKDIVKDETTGEMIVSAYRC